VPRLKRLSGVTDTRDVSVSASRHKPYFRGPDPERAVFYAAAFESAPGAIALLEEDGTVVRANRALAELLGSTEAELVDKPLPWLPRAALTAALERAARTERGGCSAEADFERASGERFQARVHIDAVRADDGTTLGAVAHISERLPVEHGEAGERDPLTGLITERELERRFAAMLAAGERGALLRIDIDGFYAVNERYGRGVGDQVLISVSEELRRSVRRSDEVARLAGDEFAVLLRDADRAGAKKVGGAVVAALARVRYGEDRSLSATVGYALTGEGENRSGELASLLAEASRQLITAGEPRAPAEANGAGA